MLVVHIVTLMATCWCRKLQWQKVFGVC